MMDLRGVRALFRGVYVTKMAERTNGLTSLVERGILKRERERGKKGMESYFGISSKENI